MTEKNDDKNRRNQQYKYIGEKGWIMHLDIIITKTSLRQACRLISIIHTNMMFSCEGLKGLQYQGFWLVNNSFIFILLFKNNGMALGNNFSYKIIIFLISQSSCNMAAS
jgi:hypothetical protein